MRSKYSRLYRIIGTDLPLPPLLCTTPAKTGRLLNVNLLCHHHLSLQLWMQWHLPIITLRAKTNECTRKRPPSPISIWTWRHSAADRKSQVARHLKDRRDPHHHHSLRLFGAYAAGAWAGIKKMKRCYYDSQPFESTSDSSTSSFSSGSCDGQRLSIGLSRNWASIRTVISLICSFWPLMSNIGIRKVFWLLHGLQVRASLTVFREFKLLWQWTLYRAWQQWSEYMSPMGSRRVS